MPYDEPFMTVVHPQTQENVHGLVAGYVREHTNNWREGVTNTLEAEQRTAVEIREAISAGEALTEDITNDTALALSF
jgi:hypothetical protein